MLSLQRYNWAAVGFMVAIVCTSVLLSSCASTIQMADSDADLYIS